MPRDLCGAGRRHSSFERHPSGAEPQAPRTPSNSAGPQGGCRCSYEPQARIRSTCKDRGGSCKLSRCPRTRHTHQALPKRVGPASSRRSSTSDSSSSAMLAGSIGTSAFASVPPELGRRFQLIVTAPQSGLGNSHRSFEASNKIPNTLFYTPAVINTPGSINLAIRNARLNLLEVAVKTCQS